MCIASIGAGIACLAAASRDPRAALLGGILALAATRSVSDRLVGSWNLSVEAGLVFVLLHSLRWFDDRHPGARLARILFAAGWIVHAFCWKSADQGAASVAIYSLTALVFVFYGAHRFISGFWGSRLVPGAAVMVSLSWPARQVVEKLQTTSPGFLAVAIGFLLFAIGTIAALTKHRWNKAVPRLE